MPKTPIRQSILNRRRALAADMCLALSLQAQERLLASAEFDSAACVALYSPIANEVFTEEIFSAALRLGKRIVYPRVRGSQLEFCEVTDRQALSPGMLGVLEPQEGRPVAPERIDLVVVPGVAFDLFGHRLGYGKGFYDRTFGARTRGLLAGFAFELQVVEQLPKEDHDVRLDLLITEARVIHFHQ